MLKKKDLTRRMRAKKKTLAVRGQEAAIPAEQLKYGVPEPEKLPNSGFNMFLPPNRKQAKWDLTPREDVFARTYVETGDFKRATDAAETSEHIARTWMARERVSRFITRYVVHNLTYGAVVGYNTVLGIATEGKTEASRLKAGMWLFERFENRILREAGILEVDKEMPSDVDGIMERIGELSRTLNLNVNVNLPEKDAAVTVEAGSEAAWDRKSMDTEAGRLRTPMENEAGCSPRNTSTGWAEPSNNNRGPYDA